MPRSFFSLAALLYAACLHSAAAGAANLNVLVDRTWIKVDSPNFSVITEQSEETARQVVNDLEALRYFKIEVLGLKPLPSEKPLSILAIGSQAAFGQLELPEGVVGRFSIGLFGYSALANIHNYRGESTTDSSARATLLHEYHHFLGHLTEQTVAYPKWIEEGMADYWSTFNVDGNKVRLGDRVTNGAGWGREGGLYSNRGRPQIDTKKLFNTVDAPIKTPDRTEAQSAGRFYSSAYFAVHYFNSTQLLRTSLASYIKMINLGYRQDRAAELAFNRSYAELDKAILQYAKDSISVRIMSANDDAFEFPRIEPTLTRLDAPALYASLAQILIFHPIERQAMTDLLVKNRELNPHDADANFLPLLLGATKGHAAILALEKRFPGYPALLTYQGDLLRQHAENLMGTGAAGWLPFIHQARDYYRRAITADPGYPRPYDGLGRVYRDMPAGEPLQEAVVGFDTASIYTRDAETFSNLAATYLRMNKPMDALPALRSALAFSKPPLQNTDALLLDNLELLNDLRQAATASSDGLVFNGGTQYIGPLSNNLPDGKGKLIRRNGSYYEGNFVQGLPSGIGKLVSDHGLAYQGEFERGFARGKGELKYAAGAPVISYKGQVDYMKARGKGVMVQAEGRYEGDLEDGRPHGLGEFVAANQALALRGKWIRGGFDWPAADGVIFTGPISADGLRHGKGLCRQVAPDSPPVPCEFSAGVRKPVPG
jgi:hypothetical protein